MALEITQENPPNQFAPIVIRITDKETAQRLATVADYANERMALSEKENVDLAIALRTQLRNLAGW